MTDSSPSTTPLRVRKLTLFSHGVASLELSAHVTDDATLNLSFPERHMNDVLKSLTVVDTTDGQIASISYEAPTDAKFTTEDNLRLNGASPLESLLETAQGASVRVQTRDGTCFTGSVLGLQWLPAPSVSVIPGSNTATQSHKTLNLVLLGAECTVSAHDIADLIAIRFHDEQMRKMLDRRMRTAMSALRSKNHKNVTITAKGAGKRNILVNYAVESPVPKLTYRFLLPSARSDGSGPETIFVQGWAIVDNPSDDDLIDIDVTIVSGLPISFRHDLYGARYVERPEEEVPTVGGPGYANPSQATFGKSYQRMKSQQHRMKLRLSTASGPAREPALMSKSGAPIPIDRSLADISIDDDAEETVMFEGGHEDFDSFSAAHQKDHHAAETSEVGDLFEYNIPTKVTIRAKESALVPLIMQQCEGGRVDIYSHKVRATNTLSAVQIKNTTDATFEGGPVSVYERSRLIGEGMMSACRPSSEQFLPYSVDLDCVAELISDEVEGQVISTFAVGDYFHTTRYRELIRKYVFQSNKTEDIDLFVLHNLDTRFKLQSAQLSFSRRAGEAQASSDINGSLEVSVKPVDVMAGVARYHFTIPSGQRALLFVREKMQQVTSHVIRTSCTPTNISHLRRSKVIDEQTAEKMKEIMQIEEKISATRAKIETAKAKIQRFSSAQQRYRDNLNSLGQLHDSKKFRDDPLIKKFLTSLGESEDKIEELMKEIQEDGVQLNRHEAAVSEKILAFGNSQLQST